MANVELSQNEYQALLDAQAEARQLKKELNKISEERNNYSKALEEERNKRKEISSKLEEYENLISEKENEFSEYKSKLSEFETYKEKAAKYEEYQQKQKEKIASKLEKIMTELGEDVLEKHNKFIENLPTDELKLEYLSELKGSKKKEDFRSVPKEDGEKEVPQVNDKLVELKRLKEQGELSPSQKIEYLTLMSKSESNVL